ncbi:MAG: ATP--guanido phosphotransferase, partial [bacterium]
MSWEEILQRPSSSWLDGRGPEQEVVISSRVRLARNLAQHLFPNRAGERELETIMNEVGTAVDGFPDRNHYYFLPLTKLGPIDRQLLVERHLTSPDHIKEPRQRGIIIRDDEGVSIMVNEEDHLRIQA